MFKMQIAAAAAAVIVSMPCAAQSFGDNAPGVMFFFSVPLDAKTPKQQMPALGLSFQGERAYQRVTVDTRMFDNAERMGFGPLAGISAKWIIAGVVATGAVVAVASKDKKTSESQQQQQQLQQQNGGGEVPCPEVCSYGARRF